MRKLPNPIAAYFNSMNKATFSFVATRLYDEVKTFICDGNLFATNDLVQLQLKGPKGVGKSTTLFFAAIALELKEKEKPTQLTYLYFSELSFSSPFLHDYLKQHGITMKPTDDLCNISDFILRQHGKPFNKLQKFVLLIDIDRLNRESKLIGFTSSFLGTYVHIRIIIAHSSGATLDHKNRQFYHDLGRHGAEERCLQNFSEEEAREYLKGFGEHLNSTNK